MKQTMKFCFFFSILITIVSITIPIGCSAAPFDDIQQKINQLENRNDRIAVYLDLADSYVKTHQIDAAILQLENASKEITLLEPLARFPHFARIAPLLHQAEKKQEAIAIIEQCRELIIGIQEPYTILAMSAALAEAAVHIEQQEKAMRAFKDLVRLMSIEQDHNGLAISNCLKAKVLVQLKDNKTAFLLVESALEITDKIQEDIETAITPQMTRLLEAPYLRANIQVIALDVLIDLQKNTKSIELVDTILENCQGIRHHEYSDEIFSSLARTFARDKQWEKAEKMLQKVGDFNLRDETRADLVEKAAEQNKLAIARKYHKSINNPLWKMQATASLSLACATFGNNKEALELLQTITNPILQLRTRAALPSKNKELFKQLIEN